MVDKLTNSSQQEIAGSYIQAKLTEKGQTQTAFCGQAHLNRGVFSHILHGRRRIDAEWANVFEEHLGETAAFWMDLQRDADLGKLVPPRLTSSSSLGHASVATAGILCDADIETLIEQGSLITEKFDASRLRGASYDCRAGFYFRDDTCFDFHPSNPIEIPKRSSLRVRTLELFHFPTNLAGNFGPTGDMTQQDLSVDAGHHIHPGYKGFLTVTVRNHTDEPLPLHMNDRFLSVRFLTMSGPATRPYKALSESPEEVGPTKTESDSQKKNDLQQRFDDLSKQMAEIARELKNAE